MKCIWKCRLQNGNHCIQAWVCWPLLTVFTFLTWINKSREFSTDHCTHDLLQGKRNIYLPYRTDTAYCLIDFTFVLVMPFHSHYSEATWASCRLESPATGLLHHQLANKTENIKFKHLRRESSGRFLKSTSNAERKALPCYYVIMAINFHRLYRKLPNFHCLY